MAWQPPEYNHITTIYWIALLGLIAMLINLLKRVSSPPLAGGLRWWQQIAYSIMVGLMTIGLGSTMIAIWPDISYWTLLGVASLSGYWGTGLALWGMSKLTDVRRQDNGRV